MASNKDIVKVLAGILGVGVAGAAIKAAAKVSDNHNSDASDSLILQNRKRLSKNNGYKEKWMTCGLKNRWMICGPNMMIWKKQVEQIWQKIIMKMKLHMET